MEAGVGDEPVDPSDIDLEAHDGLDVPEALVTDLILRRCLLAGKTNVLCRRRSLGPPSSLVERAAQELRGKKEGMPSATEVQRAR